jgi:hypothetical protein
MAGLMADPNHPYRQSHAASIGIFLANKTGHFRRTNVKRRINTRLHSRPRRTVPLGFLST